MDQDSSKDFFISYSKTDRDWAEWLAWKLEAENYTTIVREWDFRPGTNATLEIHKALQQAKHTIMLLSPDYLASLTTQPEWIAAFVQDPTGQQGKLLPVRIQACEPPGLLAAITFIDLVGSDESEAWTILLASIRKARAKPSVAPKFPDTAPNPTALSPHFPGRLLSIWDVPISAEEKKELRSREDLLNTVQKIWIAGYLENHQSNGIQIRIPLELKTNPNAVPDMLGDLIQEMLHSSSPIPADQSIFQTFEQANHALLLLGDPGSGKTNLLLELARDLLKQARKDRDHPIPVVFLLSTWANTRVALFEWMVQQLAEQPYEVSEELSRQWIKNGQIIPLFDGLDELAPAIQGACVQAINDYRKSSGHTPMAVCCRSSDYDLLLQKGYKLHLRNAVTIQPLSLQQIHILGKEHKLLQDLLQEDSELQKLASNPLWLNILVATYKDLPSEERLSDENISSSLSFQQNLFHVYVERMLNRRKKNFAYENQDVIRWLSWLANQMKRRRMTYFEINNIRASWLPEDLKRTYYWKYLLDWRQIWPLTVFGILCGSIIGFMLHSWIAALIGTGISILIINYTFMSIWAEQVENSLRERSFEERARARFEWEIATVLATPDSSSSQAALIDATRNLDAGYNTLLETLLHDAGVIPSDYQDFLDYAAERTLLRKIHEGYMFFHQSLLEYFASLSNDLESNNLEDEEAQEQDTAGNDDGSPLSTSIEPEVDDRELLCEQFEKMLQQVDAVRHLIANEAPFETLIEAYIEHMLFSAERKNRYSKQQILKWLPLLTQHALEVELISPEDLPTARLQQSYYRSVKPVSSITALLLFVFTGALVTGGFYVLYKGINRELWMASGWGSLGGLTVGLTFIFFGKLVKSIYDSEYARIGQRLIRDEQGNLRPLNPLATRPSVKGKNHYPSMLRIWERTLKEEMSVAWILGAIFGLMGGLAIGLVEGITGGLLLGILYGLVGAFLVALSITVLFTGPLLPNPADIMYYLVLRVYLWHTRMLPLNCARFLNYLVKRNILCKQSRYYHFIHPSLEKYFSSTVE